MAADHQEQRSSRRSFVTRLLSGTAGIWAAATGVGLAVAGRARAALGGYAGDETNPVALRGPKPEYGVKRMKPKYGVKRPRKYGAPPKPADKEEPKPPQKRAKKYGAPRRDTKDQPK